MTDTLERREAIKAILQETQGDVYWAVEYGRPYDWDAIVNKIDALSLPAREVSGERGLTYAAFQQRRGRLPDLIEEALSIYDEFMKDDAYDAQRPLDKIAELLRSARDFYDVTLATTPAPREMEADLADAKATVEVCGQYFASLSAMTVDDAQICFDRINATLNRLSEEGDMPGGFGE